MFNNNDLMCVIQCTIRLIFHAAYLTNFVNKLNKTQELNLETHKSVLQEINTNFFG